MPSVRDVLIMNIRFGMEEHVYNSLLYLLSALLQADAAILSLGSIFFIYKIQSLDSHFQMLAMQLAIRDRAVSYVSSAEILFLANKKEPDRRKELATMYLKLPKEYRALVTIPIVTKSLRTTITLPVWTIGLHTIASAIVLFCAPALSSFPTFFVWLSALVVFWFAWCIYLVGRTALELTTKESELELENVDDELYRMTQR